MFWFVVTIIALLVFYLKVFKSKHKMEELGVPHEEPTSFETGLKQILLPKTALANTTIDQYNTHDTSLETPRHSGFQARRSKKSLTEKKRRVNFYDEKLSFENFMKAVNANDLAMVEAYLDHGQNPNEHAGDYVTPLHIASMNGFDELVELLVSHPDINLNIKDYLDQTPLNRACRYSFLHIAEILLENGADPNLADRTGYTPLHHTALWGWDDVMSMLLIYNADPNIANAFGKTPLHLVAVDNPSMNMIRLLCENGADVNMESTLVMPVLLMCCLNCFDDNDLNTIDLLIHYDANVNIVNGPNGHTALHIAAINGFVALAKILCTAGANPNAIDRQFRTPLDLAIQMENDEMVQFLRTFYQRAEEASAVSFQSRVAAVKSKISNIKRRRNL